MRKKPKRNYQGQANPEPVQDFRYEIDDTSLSEVESANGILSLDSTYFRGSQLTQIETGFEHVRKQNVDKDQEMPEALELMEVQQIDNKDIQENGKNVDLNVIPIEESLNVEQKIPEVEVLEAIEVQHIENTYPIEELKNDTDQELSEVEVNQHIEAEKIENMDINLIEEIQTQTILTNRRLFGSQSSSSSSNEHPLKLQVIRPLVRKTGIPKHLTYLNLHNCFLKIRNQEEKLQPEKTSILRVRTNDSTVVTIDLQSAFLFSKSDIGRIWRSVGSISNKEFYFRSWSSENQNKELAEKILQMLLKYAPKFCNLNLKYGTAAAEMDNDFNSDFSISPHGRLADAFDENDIDDMRCWEKESN